VNPVVRLPEKFRQSQFDDRLEQLTFVPSSALAHASSIVSSSERVVVSVADMLLLLRVTEYLVFIVLLSLFENDLRSIVLVLSTVGLLEKINVRQPEPEFEYDVASDVLPQFVELHS
jgi:hypothetical protein